MTRLLSRLLWRTPLGWLQLKHNRARLAAALAGVAFANILIFMQLGFMGALFETSVLAHRSFSADIVLFSADGKNLADIGTLPRAPPPSARRAGRGGCHSRLHRQTVLEGRGRG